MHRRCKVAVYQIAALSLALFAFAVSANAQLDPEALAETQPRAWYAVDFTTDVALDAATEKSIHSGNFALESVRFDAVDGLRLDAVQAIDGLRVGRFESPVQKFDFPANAVALLWRDHQPEGTAIELEISVSRDGESWERWFEVDVDPHADPRAHDAESAAAIRKSFPDGRLNPNYGYTPGGLLSWGTERYQYFRYRVTLIADEASAEEPSLRDLRWFYQDTTLDGRGAGEQVRLKAIGLKAGGFAQPTVCDRNCWAARAPQCSISQMSSISRAVIHHTASQTDWNTTSQAASEANVRAHQNLHMDTRGWCDLGYNFLVDKLGNRFEGRQGSLSSNARGAHDGVNSNSIGISLMGYLHTPYNQVPTQAMRDAAYDLAAWKVEDPFDGYGSSTYGGQTVGYLAGHRDVKATACPGDEMYDTYIGTNFNGGDARDGVNARITGPQIPCCPDTPTLKSVTGSSGQITVSWSDVGTVSEYRVYASSNGTSFGSPISVASGTTSYTESVSAGATRFYKVTAVGSSQESAASDVYGAVASSAEVLIVDGNDRWVFQTSENPSGANHSFAVDAASAMNRDYDTVDNDEVESGAFSLSGYDAVVWLLGEESTAQETFSTSEQSRVQTYLNGGGNLFVSGAEIGWDLDHKGSTADRAFYNNYLKADYVADDAGTYTVNPNAGGLFDGLGSLSFSGGLMNIAYPDRIAVSGGSTGELTYSTSGLAGVSYDGAFRVVHFGFPFESINTSGDRASVMQAALDFLIGGTCGASGSVSGTSASTGNWNNYTFTVDACASQATFAISGGTGDADLYTRFGSQPTTSSWDCRPYLWGNDETCTESNPSAGTWYLGVRAYQTFSGVLVEASYN